MHFNVYPIFVKFVRLTHSNKELLTYLLKYLVAVLIIRAIGQHRLS